jgi:tetratricopeptide (TPR) repeat protein
MALIALLFAMALWGLWSPITRPAGMPDDPGVGAAREALGGELPVAGRGLVLVSAFAGESPGVAADELPLARLAAAHAHLLAAAARHRNDPRIAVTLAHLELASARFEKAERDYRAVLAGTPHHGEARLGLGIALAMRADWADPNGMTETERGLALEAMAQFANVDRGDPAYWAAVYDRAVMAFAVGRGHEAGAALDAASALGVPPAWVGRYRSLTLPRSR